MVKILSSSNIIFGVINRLSKSISEKSTSSDFIVFTRFYRQLFLTLGKIIKKRGKLFSINYFYKNI